jgi:hypothetical protein
VEATTFCTCWKTCVIVTVYSLFDMDDCLDLDVEKEMFDDDDYLHK